MNKKEQAEKLRLEGFSYNEINKKLGIPKSTLSFWLRDLKGSDKIKLNNVNKAKKKWAKNITAYNKKRSVEARKRWLVIQKDSSNKVTKISKKELFLIGVALYWAEGYKKGNWNVIFSNADARMNQIMMRFFLEICKIPKEKIKANIQIHKENQIKKSLIYWSKIINLPKKQFNKTVIVNSKSSKMKVKEELTYGTLQIRVNSVELVNKMKGWIEGMAINAI